MKLALLMAVGLFVGFAIEANAFDGPQLTAEQRSCLESKIGKPSQGQRQRVSREQMDVALEDCGVQKPDFANRDPGFAPPQLTDTQRTCLESKIGKPGQGSRPTEEQMDEAFEACDIQKPAMPSRSNFRSSGGEGAR